MQGTAGSCANRASALAFFCPTLQEAPPVRGLARLGWVLRLLHNVERTFARLAWAGCAASVALLAFWVTCDAAKSEKEIHLSGQDLIWLN